MKVLPFGKDREVNLTKTKLGIGWDVPVNVARLWDADYELTRTAMMYKVLEMGKYAVLLGTVRLELAAEEFEGLDGKLYRKAISTCQVYDLSALPDSLRDKARDLCHSMGGLQVIKFVLLGPVTFAPFQPSLFED